MSALNRSISQFLATARERNLDVKGNAKELWFTVNGVKLDSRFNVPETQVMIRLRENSLSPLILIPENVTIRPEAGISGEFINSVVYPKGWQCVFPGLFLDVDDELIELLFSVAGVLGNLTLYNLVSPEGIEKPEREEIIAEFVNTHEPNTIERNRVICERSIYHGPNPQPSHERHPPGFRGHGYLGSHDPGQGHL
jgi:hypothetical protein